MKKKIVFVILLISILIIGFLLSPYGQKLLAGKSLRTDQISDRSKEYIDSQKESNEMWKTTDLSKKGPAKATVFDVDGCFTITIPYNIIVTRKDKECDYQINTGRPKTTIIAYVNKSNVDSLDEDSGVRLRRSRSNEYQEINKKIGDRTFLIFKKKAGVFNVNAFYKTGSILLVVNMKGYTADDLSNDFYDMLSSVELNKDHVFTQKTQ